MSEFKGLADKPMTLGNHLGELRTRLVVILVAMAVVMGVCFAFQNTLKAVLVHPLLLAIEIVGPETAQTVGLDSDKGIRQLNALSQLDAPITSVKVSLYMAIAATMPIILYQIWSFVAPGLRGGERSVALWFLPGATIFFYAGVFFGYYIGLPYFFSWLIDWMAQDPTIEAQLSQRDYFKLLFALVLCFGVICDIPWGVLLLVRLGVVTPDGLAAQRKYVILGAAILSAVLSPPDPLSQIALLVPMLVLFEIGLFASRFLGTPSKKEDDDLAEEPQ